MSSEVKFSIYRSLPSPMPCQSIFNIGLYSQTYYLSCSPSRLFRVDNITDFLPANESNHNAKLAAGGGRGGGGNDRYSKCGFSNGFTSTSTCTYAKFITTDASWSVVTLTADRSERIRPDVSVMDVKRAADLHNI